MNQIATLNHGTIPLKFGSHIHFGDDCLIEFLDVFGDMRQYRFDPHNCPYCAGIQAAIR